MPIFKNVLKVFLLLYAINQVILVAVAGYFLRPSAYTPDITDVDGEVLEGSVASMEKITLGGTKQWILTRGYDTDNPVILLVHGGPGAGDIAISAEFSKELEKHFVVVSWDQRGAGKSNYTSNHSSSMNIEQFVADIHELTQLLKKRYHKDRIYIAGHSWGSMIGTLAVQKYPEDYMAYIGMGQTVDMVRGEEIILDYITTCAEAEHNQEVPKELKKISAPSYEIEHPLKFLGISRKWLAYYGGYLYGRQDNSDSMIRPIMIKAEEYSIADIIKYVLGMNKSIKLLWNEILSTNLMNDVKELEVPVYLLQGRHDYAAPAELSEEWFNNLKAPKKELIWFNNSAHWPHMEETDKFQDILINKVLPETEESKGGKHSYASHE